MNNPEHDHIAELKAMFHRMEIVLLDVIAAEYEHLARLDSVIQRIEAALEQGENE